MPCAAHDPLLDIPRIWPHFEHFEIVVRFEDQEVGFSQILLHQLGQIAEVGNNHNFYSIRAETVAYRICGIVRNRKGVDFDVSDFKPGAGVNVFHPIHFLDRALRVHLKDLTMRGFGEIGRTAPVTSQLSYRARVVGVLVGDENTVDALRMLPSQRFKTP